MSKADSTTRITELKRELGSTVVIAAHHYQDPSIVDLADLVGDSYRLSVDASRTTARHIVFCGVRFMAESALVLAREDQNVWMPNFHAGCPMADMVSAEEARPVLEALEAVLGEAVFPLTYMNSNVDMKALTGEKGGAILTSGNARKVVDHYLAKGKRILFTPDKNLGANVARDAGLSANEVLLIPRPRRGVNGSLQLTLPDEAQIKRARFFLWDGWCPVHRRFTSADVERVRARYPGVRIEVHPECDPAVVMASDAAGSTESLRQAAQAASTAPAILAMGTEASFVKRMARDAAAAGGPQVIALREEYCEDMALTNPQSLLATLEAIAALEQEAPGTATAPGTASAPGTDADSNTPANAPTRVSVDPALAANARLALTRMIDITEAPR